nr:GtrA family protein [Leucobacter edaphi]
MLIGGINTAIDFGLLFLLTWAGLPVWAANMISTGVALTFSFFANRSFAFRSTQRGALQAVKFLGVTLFGLWALQPLVILGAEALLHGLLPAPIVLGIGKIAATVVSMLWNYFLYRHFVFPDGQKGADRES